MSKLRSVIFLVLAIFFGLVASKQISKYIESRVQREQVAVNAQVERIPTQDVVVAKADIPWGTRLTDEQLEVTQWPKNYVPEGAFTNTELLIGRAAKTVLVKGEPVLEPKLAPEGFKGGMTGIIPDGKRAITIRVNEVAGVAGFVLPGSRVDIILTLDIKGKETCTDSISQVLLENMLVLAVDQKMQQEEEKPLIVNAVTLLADPKEAEKLALASTKGKLQLAMRNGLDAAYVATSGIAIGELLMRGSSNTRITDTGAKKFAVEVIRGVERSEVTFDMPEEAYTDNTEEPVEMHVSSQMMR